MGDYDQTATANAEQINAELQSLASTHGDGPANRRFSAFWGHVKQINGLFKTLKPLRPDERERLWAKLNDLCEVVKVEHHEYDEKCKANAKELSGAVESLKFGHWYLMEREYGPFWTHAKDISLMFKTLKPIRRDDSERLWQSFQSECDETRRKQDAQYESRRFKSEQHRIRILDQAERGRPCSLFGFLPPDVEEMKALGRVLQEAGQLLSKYKTEMLGEHKQECFSKIEDVRRAQDAWWESLKGHRAQRHEDFRARTTANLENDHERLRKATEALNRAMEHADELREQIASAWNDDFRDRASGWLAVEEGRITDIEASVQRIEGWIAEDERRLNA